MYCETDVLNNDSPAGVSRSTGSARKFNSRGTWVTFPHVRESFRRLGLYGRSDPRFISHDRLLFWCPGVASAEFTTAAADKDRVRKLGPRGPCGHSAASFEKTFPSHRPNRNPWAFLSYESPVQARAIQLPPVLNLWTHPRLQPVSARSTNNLGVCIHPQRTICKTSFHTVTKTEKASNVVKIVFPPSVQKTRTPFWSEYFTSRLKHQNLYANCQVFWISNVEYTWKIMSHFLRNEIGAVVQYSGTLETSRHTYTIVRR